MSLSSKPKLSLRQAITRWKFGSKPDRVPIGRKQEAKVKDAERDEGEEARSLPPFPTDYSVHYVVTERQANDALKDIADGEVGLDTEFTARRPTPEEKYIVDAFPSGGASRRNAMIGWQIVESRIRRPFRVVWANIGLRLVQIARDDNVWVMDMWKIKAFPRELKRILESPAIAKVGVGLISDIIVFWDDMRFEMVNLVDAGMMARLLLAEKHSKGSFNNLALKTCVEDILNFSISKELSESNWGDVKLSDEQKEYAGLDAIASLRIHRAVVTPLKEMGVRIGSPIPSGWYTFNTRMGEPTRIKHAPDGSEIPFKTSDSSEGQTN
ncbi:ribonuclease H-like domain-containing protein [Mycena polygramma]|nr:ribonuclease H-like domain-containing protein [Mycena polygramma]